MTAEPPAAMRVVAVRPDRDDERAIAERLLAGRRDPAALREPLPVPRPEVAIERWQSDGWFVKSRTTRTYDQPAAVMHALESLYASKRALGELCPARSTLAVTQSTIGVRLWTIAPRLVTLRERLDGASAIARADDFAAALAGYALALGESLSSSIDAGICLDASPSHFATQGGRVRYLADDVAAGRDALGIEHAFVARFAEYPRAPATAWDAYVWRFIRELTLRLSPADRLRLGLADRLRTAALGPGPGRLHVAHVAHIDRVLAALEAL